QNNVPELYFNISLNVRIDEYTWGNLPDPAYKKMMENRINDSVKAELTEVFKKLQEAKCDPMGIGNKIRAFNHNYWKSIDEQDGWKEIYPQITANFNVKTDIVRYGEIK
ncbi:MAG: gerAC, partial [Clostridiales bacterium]|nr:gerAC [Clostridiales bacterium]